jgi:hypothetical protein
MEEDTVKVNELLLWLSARVQGSWQQFKAAVEELHLSDDDPTDPKAAEAKGPEGGLPLHQEIRLMLERLGHAEFFASGCEGGWRIAPPVWAASGAEEPLSAVLCGARTLPLLERLRSTTLASADLQRVEDDPAPAVYRLIANSWDHLQSAAAATGIPACFDAPRAMLCVLSRVCELPEEIADLPMGCDWVVEQFDPQKLRWWASSREEACAARDGLFRFRLSYRRRHFLRRRGRSYEMDGAAAKYACLRRHRRSVFRYISASKECVIPASCRPPLLVERALILCCGQLPAFEASNATLTYRNVNADVARIAARLLDQEIMP